MTPELPNPSLIPFLVAVTGHRDLRPQDLDRLRMEVRSVFEDMRRRMPNTPILLLTGLAEGADQLVAEVALQQKIALIAAIPMPIDIYREQMAGEAQGKLDHLLALSSVRILLSSEGRKPEDIRASEAVRADCYESLARFLARYGQSLIALWNGLDSQKKGGTSRIVHYVRSGAMDESTDEKELLCGVVYHIVTPRMSTKTSAPEIRTVQLGCENRPPGAPKNEHHPRKESAPVARFAQVEMNFERFNRVAVNLSNRKPELRSRLISDDSVALSSFEQRLECLFEQADRISLQANGRRKLVLAAILLTAIIGTLFYGIHGEMFGENRWLWFTFPLFVSIALGLHWIAKAKHIEDTYLDDRALAEALRVQFFWAMAGITEPVDKYYLMDRRAELDWIRIALKNVWLLHHDQAAQPSEIPHVQSVFDNWVITQERWYRMKADRQSQSVRRREKFSKHALQAAVVWSILVPAGIMLVGHWHLLAPAKDFISKIQSKSDWVDEVLHVALAVPALVAGAYRLWIEQAGYEEQSRDYRSMQREFSIKARQLEKNIDATDIAQGLILSLGIEALKENGRWLMLHRERPLEVLSSP